MLFVASLLLPQHNAEKKKSIIFDHLVFLLSLILQGQDESLPMNWQFLPVKLKKPRHHPAQTYRGFPNSQPSNETTTSTQQTGLQHNT